MAIGIYFSPTSMTAQQYDDIIKQLKEAGAGQPAGRTYHACFGAADKLAVFDVWESPEAFERFGQTMLPIAKGVGVDPGEPHIMPIHSIIIG